MKKRKFVLPITGGFLALYFVIMALATFLVKEKFLEDFGRNYETKLGWMIQDIREFEKTVWGAHQGSAGTNAYSGDVRMTHYQSLLAKNLNLMSTKYQQFSGAVYDENGELMVKSKNAISLTDGFTEETGKYELEYPLDELLTQEEVYTLAKYAQEVESSRGLPEPEPYRISVMVTKAAEAQAKQEGTEKKQIWNLYRIVVQKITWATGNVTEEEDPLTGSFHSWQGDGGDAYQQVDSEIVWEWKNQDITGSPQEVNIPLGAWTTFPYLTWGYDYWKNWTESDYLQDFPEKFEEGKWKDGTALSLMHEGFTPRFGSQYNMNFVLSSDKDGEIEVYLMTEGEKNQGISFVLLSESHPWLAAADYMKYVYLGSFLFLVLCVVIIVCAVGKTYEKRALLEENRRDFTNAMAHELKTPLGIIRGMAENLQEHTAPEKTDYYIGHIIGQTEEMDRLVAEMIYTSKLDSEQFVLKKEPLSWQELVKTQIEKFAPVINEKHIQIRYDGNENECRDGRKPEHEKPHSFDLEGDKGCLEKAVWNLLSNAVHWCFVEGTITITVEKGGCSIENTGPQISEENLPHIFEMLYHGEGGRLGMGLYLTEKIAKMHGMRVQVENTQSGVRSTIG